MSEEETRQAEPRGPQLDPAQLTFLKQRLESEQNLPLAFVAGLAASLAGAAAWAGVTVLSGYQIGFMAIGIGSLIGCALGNLLAVTAMVAQNEGVGFLALLSQLTPELASQLMVATFSPMDVVFYAIALYYGYRLAFRQLGPEELQQMLSGGAGP